MGKKLVINRSTWSRGGTGGESSLLNNIGNQCCLGFLASSCGYTADEIRNRLTPYTVEARELWPQGIIKSTPHISNSPWTQLAMLINDNDKLSRSNREEMLQHLFEIIDIEVEFTGDDTQLLDSLEHEEDLNEDE